VVVFGAGCWATGKYYENKLASIEAKHEQAILDLQRKNSQIVMPQISIQAFHSGERNAPKLSEAEVSTLSMSAFAKLHPQNSAAYRETTSHLTTIQKQAYVDELANKSFTWTGYVSDVRMEGSTQEPEYLVEIRLDAQKKDSFSATCVFAGKEYSEMMKALIKDAPITVRGVRAESGRLLDCRLVRSDGGQVSFSIK